MEGDEFEVQTPSENEIVSSLERATKLLDLTNLEEVEVSEIDFDHDLGDLEGELSELLHGTQSARPWQQAPSADGSGLQGASMCPEAIFAKKREMLAAGAAKKFQLVRTLKAEIKSMETVLRSQPEDATKAASAAYSHSERREERCEVAEPPSEAEAALPQLPKSYDQQSIPPTPPPTSPTTNIANNICGGGIDWKLQERIAAKRREAIDLHKANRIEEAKTAYKVIIALEGRQVLM